MKYTQVNKPLECIMSQSTCYKNTKKMEVFGVLWHSTGANNAFIKRYVQPDDNAKNRAELLKKIGTNTYKNDWNHVVRQAGVNAFIGKLADGSVAAVQTLPWNYRPWGCGSGAKGTCNDHWIQFEICEDALTDKTYFDKIFEEGCQLTAYLCKMYGIDPYGTVTFNSVKVPTILDHTGAHGLKLGSDHGDIQYWFKKYGKTMASVRSRVKSILDVEKLPQPSTSTNTGNTGTTTTTTIFEVGDVVKITGTLYYSGKTIPTWVKQKNWIVSSAPKGSSRIVLGKSEDGRDSVDSAFNAKDLQLVKKADKIEKGDTVQITYPYYYSGKTVPAWVLQKWWIVSSAPASSDRIVLGKSSDGKETLDSAFARSSLKIIKKA